MKLPMKLLVISLKNHICQVTFNDFISHNGINGFQCVCVGGGGCQLCLNRFFFTFKLRNQFVIIFTCICNLRGQTVNFECNSWVTRKMPTKPSRAARICMPTTFTVCDARLKIALTVIWVSYFTIFCLDPPSGWSVALSVDKFPKANIHIHWCLIYLLVLMMTIFIRWKK